MPTPTRRRLPLVAVLTGACLAVTAACGDDVQDGASAADAACAAFSAYSGHRGTTVTIFSPIRDVEADRLQKSWEEFSGCTEITIKYEGSGSFETDIGARVAAGSLPDLAFFPQPGLLGTLAHSGALKPAAPAVRANVEKWYSPEWLRYGTVDGTFYAAPLDANVKSFVWYSPSFFAAKGYQVPATWAELLALTERIAKDGVKPWCVGIESGVATGWPLTDWLEDVVLRAHGPGVYDDWVAHRIPFDDPRIVASLDQVGRIVRNPRYVNGGYGGLPSVVTTSYQEGGLPILEGGCALHRQASFYANHWPVGAKVAEDGDVYAFYLPPIDAKQGNPVLGAGSFVGTFATRPEVQAVATYLSTPEWVNSRASLGGAVNASRGLDRNLLHTPIDKLSAQLLVDETTTFRFDGSDMMPGAVGSGTFWTGMTSWARGADTKTVLSRIEASWPRP